MDVAEATAAVVEAQVALNEAIQNLEDAQRELSDAQWAAVAAALKLEDAHGRS